SSCRVLVEVTIGLRRHVQRELVENVLRRARDRDVMERDDTRQRGDAADEIAELVIAAGEPNLDRELGVEILLNLAGRLEQLLLEPRGEACLGDVDEKARHLRLAGQLPQHRAERALDLGKLFSIRVEIRRLALLLLERRAKLLLLALTPIERLHVR